MYSQEQRKKMYFNLHTINDNIIQGNDYILHNESKIFKSIEQLFGFIGLMCPYCYNYIIRSVRQNNSIFVEQDENSTDEDLELWGYSDTNFRLNKCKCCGVENINLIQIDVNLVDIISILNKKKYYTKFCCESHDNDDNGYIMFEDRSIMNHMYNLPLSVNFNISSFKQTGIIKIEFEYCNKTDALIELAEWATSLPENNNTDSELGESISDFNDRLNKVSNQVKSFRELLRKTPVNRGNVKIMNNIEKNLYESLRDFIDIK